MTAAAIFSRIKRQKKQIREYCLKTGVVYLGLFGSVARREKRFTGDIDILVRFGEPKGLEFISIKNDLSKMFKQRVDLVTENALHPLLKKQILKDTVTIYENK